MFKLKFKNINKIFVVLILFFVATASTLVAADEIRFRSNRFTQMEPMDFDAVNYNTDLTGFQVAGQNQYLTLFVNPYDLSIKVRNGITGYIWSSTLDDMENYRLNQTWRNFVSSAVTIDYVIGDATRSRESLLTNNSTFSIQNIENGFVAAIEFGSSGIKMDLAVVVENADVVVTVLNDSIYEPEGVQLISMQLFPFLGATFEDSVTGYMFIPDGAGALIRFEEMPEMNAPFRGMFYGDDYGISFGAATTINLPHVLIMPVYGMVHGVGQDAFLTIVEGGDHYAELIAHTAGTFTEFNWITPTFHYRQSYFQPTTRDITRGPTILLMQEERNQFDLIMRHRILSGNQADYVGMALTYQERLVETGVLTPLLENGPMLRLDILAAETEPGLIWNNLIVMTHVTDVVDMVASLQSHNVNQFMVNYFGWARGGLSNSFPYRSRFERRAGSRNEVHSTIQTLEEYGVPMFFHTDYVLVQRGANRLFGGTRINQQITTRPIDRTMIPKIALGQVERDLRNFERYGITNLAIMNTASFLYSTWNPGFEATRTQNLATNQAIIDQLNEGDIARTALYNPNANHWHQTLHFFDVPMTASGYLFATDTVPFLHIVLRGHINYYASPSNFSANSRGELLRKIEFGAYPSFILTNEPSHLLADTRSRNIFTSEFTLWEDTIVEYYQIINAALGEVRGQRIVTREVLTPGVVKVTYENQVQIIVNYTNHEFNFNNVIVEAEGFAVIRAGESR